VQVVGPQPVGLRVACDPCLRLRLRVAYNAACLGASIGALSEDGPSSHPVSQPSESLAVESTLLALETADLASRYTPPPPPGVSFDVQIALQIPLLQHPTLILVIARRPAVNQIILPAFWYLETNPRSDKAMSCTGKISQYWTPLHSLTNTWRSALYSRWPVSGLRPCSTRRWECARRIICLCFARWGYLD
jgi:hypothetical protein